MNPEDLTLPVYKEIERMEQLTSEESMALHDNDPVAETEFREMATLFLQMHDFVFGVNQTVAHTTGVRPSEGVRIMEARTQALVDRTNGFTRPLRVKKEY